ncbi:hypothetical protein EV688_12139 [Chromatocurvus halotolerans]|uniref:Uncharacterized protein n=2 Tax=Chromatocurvus halotolerans TaxID=1132028 RepID=A0A4R2KYK7_9GAMM|nr:hypothetical protein EV688_12139 [Chromatocurvus halotolerans]
MILAPDQPVIRYSPEMDSCFEQLHRAASRGMRIPESIDSIIGLVRQLKELYYIMRDHLEADDGMSAQVAEALPELKMVPLLKMLHSWEQDAERGMREYEARDVHLTPEPIYTDPAYDYLRSPGCWQHYRFTMFEANRALNICRGRICVVQE